jgi:NTE family protein
MADGGGHHRAMIGVGPVSPKAIQVALSGSGFLLPVHLGALQAIEAAGYHVSALSGTSGGAIVAALYAVLPNTRSLTELVLYTDWQPFMNFDSWTNGWRLLTRRGICATAALDTFLIRHTQGQSFADLDRNLFICATDLLRGQRTVFSRAQTPNLPVAVAARASSSLPFVYPPKQVDGCLYVDGGLTDDIPGDLLPKDAGVPSVGVYLTGKPPHLQGREPTLFALASLSVRDLLRGQEYLDRHAAPWVRFVAVDTGNLNMLDARMPRADREHLMELGRVGMEKLLQDLAA